MFALAYIVTPSTSSPQVDPTEINDSLYKQFLSYEKLPHPTIISPLQLIPNKLEFKDSKLQILIFSDFECPACKSILPTVKSIVEKYKTNISFLYYPYPLDHSCHP